MYRSWSTVWCILTNDHSLCEQNLTTSERCGSNSWILVFHVIGYLHFLLWEFPHCGFCPFHLLPRTKINLNSLRKATAQSRHCTSLSARVNQGSSENHEVREHQPRHVWVTHMLAQSQPVSARRPLTPVMHIPWDGDWDGGLFALFYLLWLKISFATACNKVNMLRI